MTKHIPLREIVDNPFQSRSVFDQETIQSLADEIKAEGFWNGSLQGRRTTNGKIELVFGHRRLRALRLLKAETVPIELVDLTDAQMALRNLEENLQRQGLTDFEKADAIKQLVELERQERKARGKPEQGAIQVVADRLGLTKQWISELAAISSTMVDNERDLIERSKLSARAAYAAKQWGGEEYVRTLAKQSAQYETDRSVAKPSHMIPVKMKAVVNAAPKAVQERLKADIVSGKVITPQEAEQRARRLAAAHVKREKEPPPDLREVIVGWTHRIDDWEKQLRDVKPYMAYVEEVPAIAERFRAALKRFIDTAKELL